MSFSGDLRTFNDSAKTVAREFSGGVFDTMNQRVKVTGDCLANFSCFCAGIRAEAAKIVKDVQKFLPKGSVGIDEEMRNFDRSIGWDARIGNFCGSSGPSTLPRVGPGMKTLGGLPQRKLQSVTPSVGSSIPQTTTQAHAKPTPYMSSSIHTVTTPISKSVSAHGARITAMTRSYRDAFETFRTKMFSALRYCGMSRVKAKEVVKALDSASRKVAELNALIGRKFDADEINRRVCEVKRLNSDYKSCCTGTENRISQEQVLLARLNQSFQRDMPIVRNRIGDMEVSIGRRPRWMKKRLSQLAIISSRHQEIVSKISANIQHNNANVGRLNRIASLLAGMSGSLSTAIGGENSRRSSIQACRYEIDKALKTACIAHKAISPRSTQQFALRTSGSCFAITPSISNASLEQQRAITAFLGQIESSAAQIFALQKPTECLTASDINDTDVFPAFIVADSCAFVDSGRTYCVPIPTAFPLSRPRCFSDVTEIAPFLLRLIVALPVGSVQITIIDHASGGANGSVFNGLMTGPSVFRLVPRIDELHTVLKEHSDYIADLSSSGKFGATDRTWSEYNAHHPKNPLPCKILVVYSFRGWDWQDVSELGNLVANGSASGVHVLFSNAGIDELDERLREQIEAWNVARNPVDAAKWAKEGASLELRHVPMRMPSNAIVGRICTDYVDRLEKRSARAAHVFGDLFEGVPQWSASSIDGLEATIGWDALGNPVNIRIGGDNQHGLIGGKTGGGKSNLIHVIICSLCHRYSPDELQICLLDMKDGVEAFRYLDENRTKAWIPHARSILASDSPHFASTFLDEIAKERETRNDIFKRDGAVNISGWRKATGRKMPRLLVIADEFTRIFADSDSSKESARKLADLLNLGRSCGIHVLLATQSTDSLVTSNASVILSQTTLRLALPEAKGVLSHGNTDAETLVRPQAIVNEFSGAAGKNTVFTHPFFDNETRSPTDAEIYRHNVELAVSRISLSCRPACRIVDGVSLQPVPPISDFRKLLGPMPIGARPRFNILLGRTDDFNANPFLVPISGDSHTDHLLIVAAKDPEGRKGVWEGMRTCVMTSLGLLPSHQILFYNPLLEHPAPGTIGMTVLGADADEDMLKGQLSALRDSKAKHRIFVVENFDRATFLSRDDDDPYGPVDESSTFGLLSSAFDRKKHTFTVILFARDPVMSEELLGDKGWRCISNRIAFGFETPTALRSVIKGTELLDNLGESVFFSSPTTGGGFRTILPFASCQKGRGV